MITACGPPSAGAARVGGPPGGRCTWRAPHLAGAARAGAVPGGPHRRAPHRRAPHRAPAL